MYDNQIISKADYEQAYYQLHNAKAAVTQRLTMLNQARTNLGYASIYAPIDGIILSKEVEVGQTVAATMSAPTLFKIAKDIKKMQVEANVDEADIGQVKVGQRVTFTVDAYPLEEFQGGSITSKAFAHYYFQCSNLYCDCGCTESSGETKTWTYSDYSDLYQRTQRSYHRQ